MFLPFQGGGGGEVDLFRKKVIWCPNGFKLLFKSDYILSENAEKYNRVNNLIRI